MLTVIPRSAATLSTALWIDLVDPTDDERQRVEQATKLRMPTKTAIEEIESSSRVFSEGAALYLSTPVLPGTDWVTAAVTNVGFVLSATQLVTLRFGRVATFDAVTARLADAEVPRAGDAFMTILEAIVEQAADTLELASGELERLSHAAFHAEPAGRRHSVVKASRILRGMLRKIGRMGDGVSHIRDTLLGIGRIASYVQEGGKHINGTVDVARLIAIRNDIGSLNEYLGHLSTKIQFLLDATLGFISIEQNEIVKTLTVASVVGVPPVLVAGIYGMNFRVMPELGWRLGYPFALALIVISALLPIAWFKWRGWM
jgi:magnesium transporter